VSFWSRDLALASDDDRLDTLLPEGPATSAVTALSLVSRAKRSCVSLKSALKVLASAASLCLLTALARALWLGTAAFLLSWTGLLACWRALARTLAACAASAEGLPKLLRETPSVAWQGIAARGAAPVWVVNVTVAVWQGPLCRVGWATGLVGGLMKLPQVLHILANFLFGLRTLGFFPLGPCRRGFWFLSFWVLVAI
jgi:hypothetical protein